MYSIFEKLLQSKGVTAYQVSKATGINQSFFSYWKSGKTKNPKPNKLEKIADYFGVSVDYLLGRTNEPTYNDLDKQLEGLQFAVGDEIHDLTDTEKQDILNFVKYVKSKRSTTNEEKYNNH